MIDSFVRGEICIGIFHAISFYKGRLFVCCTLPPQRLSHWIQVLQVLFY
jgi:hypothetical protein